MLERRKQTAQTCRAVPISVVNPTSVLPILGHSIRSQVIDGTEKIVMNGCAGQCRLNYRKHPKTPGRDLVNRVDWTGTGDTIPCSAGEIVVRPEYRIVTVLGGVP
jgi:hypothetical protein